MTKLKSTIIVGIFFLASLVSFLPLNAQADTLYMGTSYNIIDYTYNSTTYTGNRGGGSFDVSKLNDVVLPYLYCVDLNSTITLGTTYNDTVVRTDGYVKNGYVNNASQVAFLLFAYANDASGTAYKEAALQAAIWEVIYGDNFTLASTNSTDIKNQYDSYIKGIGTHNVAAFRWITPQTGTTMYQGQVTGGGSGENVPIPPTAWLLGAGLVGLIGLRRKFQK